MGWLHISGPVVRPGRTEAGKDAILWYYTMTTGPESRLERHFLLFLKLVADSELVGFPDHVRTHENVFRVSTPRFVRRGNL
jgi:hypothetical protein